MKSKSTTDHFLYILQHLDLTIDLLPDNFLNQWIVADASDYFHHQEDPLPLAVFHAITTFQTTIKKKNCFKELNTEKLFHYYQALLAYEWHARRLYVEPIQAPLFDLSNYKIIVDALAKKWEAYCIIACCEPEKRESAEKEINNYADCSKSNYCAPCAKNNDCQKRIRLEEKQKELSAAREIERENWLRERIQRGSIII